MKNKGGEMLWNYEDFCRLPVLLDALAPLRLTDATSWLRDESFFFFLGDSLSFSCSDLVFSYTTQLLLDDIS